MAPDSARKAPPPHPYSDLPADRFWRTGVAETTPQEITDLYVKKFDILPTDRIATAGSCFAQHVAVHLAKRGFPIVDMEPPLPGMPKALAQRYGYSIYSARYGNLYTARQLLQLVQDARRGTVREEDVFERDGRWFDGLRPGVEPHGLPRKADVLASRAAHLKLVARMLRRMDVFVFTFGLTETWENVETGTVYPVCPGVIAGDFDPAKYRFRNLTHAETLEDFLKVHKILTRMNKDLKTLVTVSPVPLTATAAGRHVLQSTTYSKSVLRAVCGELADGHDSIDYFPSYEIITAPFSRGAFFEDNMRSVTPEGVETVMRVFFDAHGKTPRAGRAAPSVTAPQTEQSETETESAADAAAARPAKAKKRKKAARAKDDLQCEEVLLDAFAKKRD